LFYLSGYWEQRRSARADLLCSPISIFELSFLIPHCGMSNLNFNSKKQKAGDNMSKFVIYEFEHIG
jgi:hypothetical protein